MSLGSSVLVALELPFAGPSAWLRRTEILAGFAPADEPAKAILIPKTPNIDGARFGLAVYLVWHRMTYRKLLYSALSQ
jgi:hypothetical protein